jgi:predicted DNA-binding ribbon-helix-helix protein
MTSDDLTAKAAAAFRALAVQEKDSAMTIGRSSRPNWRRPRGCGPATRARDREGAEGQEAVKQKRIRKARREKSPVVKRSVTIAGHWTSVTLENDFSKVLEEIAIKRDLRPAQLIAMIDKRREHQNLSAAIRPFILKDYRRQLRTAQR